MCLQFLQSWTQQTSNRKLLAESQQMDGKLDYDGEMEDNDLPNTRAPTSAKRQKQSKKWCLPDLPLQGLRTRNYNYGYVVPITILFRLMIHHFPMIFKKQLQQLVRTKNTDTFLYFFISHSIMLDEVATESLEDQFERLLAHHGQQEHLRYDVHTNQQHNWCFVNFNWFPPPPIRNSLWNALISQKILTCNQN